jgi:hypothetical protein
MTARIKRFVREVQNGKWATAFRRQQGGFILDMLWLFGLELRAGAHDNQFRG